MKKIVMNILSWRRTLVFFLSAMFSVFMFIHFRPDPSKLDYDSACLVARYLSSKRPFAQSFDIYLTQVSLKQPNNKPS